MGKWDVIHRFSDLNSGNGSDRGVFGGDAGDPAKRRKDVTNRLSLQFGLAVSRFRSCLPGGNSSLATRGARAMSRVNS